MPPGGTSSLHLLSSGLMPLLRNRSVPSRRESLHLGPRYLAIFPRPQTRRFLGGRQPLCGIGVTSSMLVTLSPQAFSARTADSRPGPGPRTRTSTVRSPYSCAATPAFSAATCAANGVLLREPRNPEPPDVAQDSVLPWRSVIVMIVLLKDAWTWATPSETWRLTFLRALPAAAAAPPLSAAAFASPLASGLASSFCSAF